MTLLRRSVLAAVMALPALAQMAAPIRPPATPLLGHDPYFSVWSAADELTAQTTKHWTGTEQPLTGLIGIDGKVRRFLGVTPRWAEPIPELRQTARGLTPTRTLYSFEGEGVRLDVTFLTPALAGDLEALARPVTYIAFDVRSADGKPHRVRLYVDAASHLAVDTPAQRAMWGRFRVGSVEAIRLGSVDQKMLSRSGDNLRIDWGYFYLAAPEPAITLGITAQGRARYLNTLELPRPRDLEMPEQTDRSVAVAAIAMDLEVPAAGNVSRYLVTAYDDIYSLEYFKRPLRPYWRRNRAGAEELLTSAVQDFPALQQRCERFDEELTVDLVRVGGPRYAAIAILAYRQTLFAHKLAADFDGTALHFSKENFSNGCMGTVDVIYPAAPMFLLLSPKLLEAQLRPVLDYARSGRWKWPYAPHDLGQYPLANGQVYGGGEETEDRQMPVEESGNMLILLGALAKVNGNAEFSRPYWPILTRWAEFLAEKGMDPDNQLSTDDFAGHLAHNTNLSIKAILGLGSYALLGDALGQKEQAAKYRKLAREFAAKWPEMA
ncbi:MAG TPA: glutaminase, partial [Solibacterales bacterium]|nr:glutaminase [Bryobacterales bacterium]